MLANLIQIVIVVAASLCHMRMLADSVPGIPVYGFDELVGKPEKQTRITAQHDL